jgi:hypothetical protein
MTITALPTPPSRADSPSDFASKADALLGALPTLVTEMNAATADVTAKEASATTAATTATTKAGDALTSAGAAAASASAASTSATNAAGDRVLAQTAAASITAQVAVATHAATSKATPVDADEIPLADSAASFGLKKLTIANLKALFASAFAALNVVQVFTAAQRGAVMPLTDAATITPDFAAGNNFAVGPYLAGNRTLANPTNLVSGQSGVIFLPQDNTGSRTLTLGWGWPTVGVLLSTVAGTVDALAYYVAVSASSNVTISNATPGVVTWTAHGLLNGQKIRLTTTGALPTGLSLSTTYYVKWIDANTFQLSAAIGGASIATSSAGSGVHTCTAATIQAALSKGVM